MLKEDSVKILILVNWTAPQLLTAQVMRAQAGLAGQMLNGNGPSAVGALLLPAWVRGRGQLWKAQDQCVKLLTQAAINFDSLLVLQFESHTDSREHRPLALQGRILFGTY